MMIQLFLRRFSAADDEGHIVPVDVRQDLHYCELKNGEAFSVLGLKWMDSHGQPVVRRDGRLVLLADDGTEVPLNLRGSVLADQFLAKPPGESNDE